MRANVEESKNERKAVNSVNLEEQYENLRKHKRYSRRGIWVALAALIFLYSAQFEWLPFAKTKSYGAALAALTGYEAIISFLTGRMSTRRLDVTAEEKPVSFWLQVIGLAVFAIAGIMMVLFG